MSQVRRFGDSFAGSISRRTLAVVNRTGHFRGKVRGSYLAPAASGMRKSSSLTKLSAILAERRWM